MRNEKFGLEVVPFPIAQDTDTTGWDPRLGVENERLTPTKDLKDVQIGPLAHHVTKIGTSLFEEEGRKLDDQLIRNVDLLIRTLSDMSGINT